MEIDKNKLTFAVLAAVIASMTFAANGGIKPTFAQVAGVLSPLWLFQRDKTSLFCLVDLLLFFSSFDFALLKFLGRVLNLYPQHGHRSPFHFMNISHC
jgi:hypothetical protein